MHANNLLEDSRHNIIAFTYPKAMACIKCQIKYINKTYSSTNFHYGNFSNLQYYDDISGLAQGCGNSSANA